MTTIETERHRISDMSVIERVWWLEGILRVVKKRKGKWTEQERSDEVRLRELTLKDVRRMLDKGLTVFEIRNIGRFHVCRSNGKRKFTNLGEVLYDALKTTEHVQFEYFKRCTLCLRKRKMIKRNPPPVAKRSPTST